MATEIVMPKLGLTMTEGTVEKLLVNEGDKVEAGDPVIEISSEKLTSEVEAPASGTIIEFTAQEGDVIPYKEVMAYVGEEGEVVDKSTSAPSAEPSPEEEETTENNKPEPKQESKPADQEAGKTDQSERIFITPLARKMAKEQGIDIRDVNGTGGNGRITRLDINRYTPSAKTSAKEVPASAASSEMEYGAGLTGMRKTIAQRMMRSVQTTAQVTNQRKIDVTRLMEFRNEIKEKVDFPLDNGELSVNTLLTKAVVLSLLDMPSMNGWYYDGEYTTFDEVHIGMATAIDDGLVVPVIKDAHNMSLSRLGSSIKEVVSQTRKGTLDGSLYSGSTFTITNLGGADIEYFTPILNTPEVGILGVGAIQKELDLDEQGTVIQKQKLPLSLSFDHQVIDGAPAAEFLQKIAGYLQNPYRILF
ncbi:pyruvate dehydrogenase E2 component (dihydrolipoamide acetyltransferase) [Lentibacillus persicus]|uniref:Dihydrolipoamide acetyltransferase component of pyruvate dehydrogenase complex n=1 Tax=Lentibacillus persicus TaxID=640948 RepID=A0A1I1S8G3_9BACI|nr:dihydrolipoamide acetyltransferase family protein [Lentibacillus persicus]SFD42791.1 pyruvate dehydrogenase E2 component (dihydrolipoamide acetyltransferase) [Lentibacillus persicus]